MPSPLSREKFGSFLGSRWMLYGPVLLLSGLLAGAGWYGWNEYQRKQLAAVEAKKVPPPPDPLTQTFQGKIRALKTVLVPAPLAGTLESVDVTDGQEVFEGQVLAKIQNTSVEVSKQKSLEDLERSKGKASDLESQLMAARLEASRASSDLARVRSEYETAARAFERQQKLFREGATARKAYEKSEADYRKLIEESKGSEQAGKQAEARVSALQASVEEARQKVTEMTEEIEDTDAELLTGEVKAPVSGLLVAHRADAGGEVTRDMKDLFEIAVDLTAMEVAVEVPAPVAAKLAAGSRAFVQISEGGDSPLNGTLREVKEAIAYVEFLSPSPAIKPGMTAHVRFLH